MKLLTMMVMGIISVTMIFTGVLVIHFDPCNQLTIPEIKNQCLTFNSHVINSLIFGGTGLFVLFTSISMYDTRKESKLHSLDKGVNQ